MVKYVNKKQLKLGLLTVFLVSTLAACGPEEGNGDSGTNASDNLTNNDESAKQLGEVSQISTDDSSEDNTPIANEDEQVANPVAESNTSNDVEKVKALVADVKSWQDILQLETPEALIDEATDSYDQAVVPSMVTMKNALAQAGAWGFLPVLPELAITSMCNTLKPEFAASLCNSLITTDNIESVCVTGSGLTILGTDICEFFTEIVLVNNEQLTVTYYFFDSTITVAGEINQQEVDFTLSTNTVDGNYVAFNMAGSIIAENASLVIDEGIVGLSFAEPISLIAPKLPDTAEFSFSGELAQTNDITGEMTQFTGEMDAAIDLTTLGNEISESQSLSEGTLAALTSGELLYSATLSGELTSSNGNNYTSELVLEGGLTHTFELDASIYETTMSGPAQLAVAGMIDIGLSDNDAENSETSALKPPTMVLDTADFSYDGRAINITPLAQDSQVLSITNRDDVLVTLDTSAELGDVVGTAEVNGEQHATIIFESGVFTINYSDNTSEVF